MSGGDKKFLETSDIFRALIPHFYANTGGHPMHRFPFQGTDDGINFNSALVHDLIIQPKKWMPTSRLTKKWVG